MKLNVKGLVFVGFAAAVFASAAQADGDKIVTSKTYVDNKITQTIGTSTTTAPSENAVKGALDLKYDANNPDGFITSADVPVKGIKAYGAQTNLEPDGDGVVTLPQAAAVNDGTLSIQVGSNPAQTFTANTAGNTTVTLGAAAGKGVATEVTANGTDLPTAGAVNTAITSALNGLDTTAYTAGDNIDITNHEISVTGLGTAAAANVSTTGVGANETNLVTGQQVNTAITGALNGLDTTEYTAGSNIDITNHEISVTGLGTAAAANVSTNGVASGDTGLVSGGQVYTAINGKTFEPGTCSSYPCALVITAANTYGWEPIQQPSGN